jgi:hypothetical protein
MTFADPSRPVPDRLVAASFVLRPITTADAERDHAAVMETRDELRVWEQSSWPEDDFTVEANRADLADLEQRHAADRAYTYTMLDPSEHEAWGCVYVFPTDATFLTKATVTPIGPDEWSDVDAVVYFWVRAAQSHRASVLLDVLRTWFADAWALAHTVYVTNERYERQVRLFSGAGLTPRFEVREPGKPGAYLGFA